ncbi:hypothetical protein Bbelb_270970 [Branchiostoma belcheri]|nr:hypothetical protein Bbelb_270970 [Branchiostoma belcheri]
MDVETQPLGLMVSWNKTKVQSLSDYLTPPAGLVINSHPVEAVDRFCYLGGTITTDCKSDSDIQLRIGRAASAMASLNTVWASSDISHRTKLRLYSLVLSILLYGAETWTLTAAQERRLDAFDSKCQRRILGIRWFDHVSTDALREQTNQPPLSSKIRSARLRLFGHIARAEPPLELGSLVREPPPSTWSRPRGRPRRTWTDLLSAELQAAGLDITSAWVAARDRKTWRAIQAHVKEPGVFVQVASPMEMKKNRQKKKDIPEQVTPFPVYPKLQEQVKEPNVFVQVAVVCPRGWVRQINYKLDGLNARKSNLKKLLRKKLSDETFAETKEFITRGQLDQHEKGKDRQKTKFDRLQQKKTISAADSDPNWKSNSSEPKTTTQAKTDERWVKNLSSHTITEAEESLLSKGLNFAVAPNKIPSIDFVTETESAIRRARLPQRQAEALRTKVATTLKVSKPPASNITREERTALKDLATNQDILILPADKGRCTVVLDREQYDRKVQDLLGDKDTYTSLKKDPTNKFKGKISSALKKLQTEGVLDRPSYLQLNPTTEQPPAFYGLPKIHKQSDP